jgi:hypothetical protein
MMRRETLEGYRRVVGKMDYHPSAERERQLIDSHLEALREIDRLRSIPAHPRDQEGKDFV